MRNQFTALWLVFPPLFSVTLADNTQVTTTTDSGTAETRVGWYAGPTERGTLALVYSCLATVITCTWTVLHLNVPALKDGPWKRGFRKARWMAITILFPEFIFAKAICELRSALRDLLEFDKTLRNEYKDGLTCKVPSPFKEYPDIAWSWKTKFPRGRVIDLIYPLMGLPCPSPLQSGGIADATDAGRGSNDVASSIHSRDRSEIMSSRTPLWTNGAETSKPITTQSQDWTLTHSYLANMGGLTYNDLWDQENEPVYHILTGTHLSRCCGWSFDHHPLQSLVLSENDIKDRSKADWFLKTISILQISWLVLTVISRLILKLPLTQLEIATLAFSFFAIATFTANWWKPKDISTPIRISCSAKILIRTESQIQEDNDPYLHAFDRIQSFISRLLSPAKTRRESQMIKTDKLRIENDMVEMEGNVPLLTPLMAVAGFVFGGLHCLAWNFPFPSQTEMILWRFSSIGSAIVPFISLVVSIFLNYLVTGSLDKYLMKELQPLTKYSEEYINMLRKPVFVTDWDLDEIIAFYAQTAGQHNFEIPPEEHEQRGFERNKEARHTNIEKHRAMAKWHPFFCTFLNIWENPPTDNSNGFVTSRLQNLAHHMVQQTGLEITLEVWEEYEKSYIQERVEFPLGGPTCAGHIMSTMKKFEAKQKQRTKLTDQASRVLAITSGIIYTTTRLIILVLLFTSLRDVPIGVYESTPWTRFLPSFS